MNACQLFKGVVFYLDVPKNCKAKWTDPLPVTHVKIESVNITNEQIWDNVDNA